MLLGFFSQKLLYIAYISQIKNFYDGLTKKKLKKYGPRTYDIGLSCCVVDQTKEKP